MKSKSKPSLKPKLPQAPLPSYATNSKEDPIQSISRMIVALEKEQAEIKQGLRELERTRSNENKCRKLRDLMTRNEHRLNEARGIQEDLIRSSIPV